MDALTGDWRMLVNGERLGSSETREVENPATGEIIAKVPEATLEQVDAALAAARKAQPGWAALTSVERAAVMRRIAGLIRRDADTLARIIVI